MYADDKNRPIPTSMDKCVERGEIEKDLWKWSELVETIGVYVCMALAIAGFFLALFISVEQGNTGYYHSSKEATFNGMKFIISLGICGVVAFVQYVVFRIAALLLGALASIVENTRISANIAMYEASKEEPQKAE